MANIKAHLVMGRIADSVGIGLLATFRVFGRVMSWPENGVLKSGDVTLRHECRSGFKVAIIVRDRRVFLGVSQIVRQRSVFSMLENLTVCHVFSSHSAAILRNSSGKT
jgi:hypothetical protein